MFSVRMSGPRRVALAGGICLLLLAGCGDDGGNDDEASSDSGTDATETTEAAEAEVAGSCLEVPEPEDGAVNQTATVNLIDFEICQEEITIQAGEAIAFVNNGATRHQVAHDAPEGEGRFFRSDPLLTGDTFIKTFETPGTYPYFCSFHFEKMTGTITVE